MLVTIAYGPDYETNAKELGAAVLAEWTNADLNYVGLSSPEYAEKYQVQLEKDIVYSKKSDAAAETAANIITKIKERL